MVATTDKTTTQNNSSMMIVEYHPVEYYSVDDFLATFKPLEKPRYIRSTVKAADIQEKKNELKASSLDGKTVSYQVNEALTAIDEGGVKSIVNGVHRFYAISELATEKDGKLKPLIRPIPVKIVKSEVNDYVITSLQSKANDTTIKHSAIDKMRAIKKMWEELLDKASKGEINLDETKIRKFLQDNYQVTKGYLVQINNVLTQPAWLINMIDLELISPDTVQEITSAWKKFEKDPEKLAENNVTLQSFVEQCALIAGAKDFAINDDNSINYDINDKKAKFKIYASHVTKVESAIRDLLSAKKPAVVDAGGGETVRPTVIESKINELKETGHLNEENAKEFQKLVKQYGMEEEDATKVLENLSNNIAAEKIDIERRDIEDALKPYKPEEITSDQLQQAINDYKRVKSQITEDIEGLITSTPSASPKAHEVLKTSLKLVTAVLTSYYSVPSRSNSQRLLDIMHLCDNVVDDEASILANEEKNPSLKMAQNISKIHGLLKDSIEETNLLMEVVLNPEPEKTTETATAETATVENKTETIVTDITAEDETMVATVE